MKEKRKVGGENQPGRLSARAQGWRSESRVGLAGIRCSRMEVTQGAREKEPPLWTNQG